MSQRVVMAQELLTMVQSNPEIHGPQGIYEAYYRMYSALGVDNIESLLLPPQDMTPKPVDAGIENSGLLQGIPANAFAEQNHEAHIEAHKSLFLTQSVQMNPQLAICNHCSCYATFTILGKSNSRTTNAT
jgi:hypothetical protein